MVEGVGRVRNLKAQPATRVVVVAERSKQDSSGHVDAELCESAGVEEASHAIRAVQAELAMTFRSSQKSKWRASTVQLS